MGFMSCHIMPVVINSLGGGHTHTHTGINVEAVSRSQVDSSLWPGARFKYALATPHARNNIENKICYKIYRWSRQWFVGMYVYWVKFYTQCLLRSWSFVLTIASVMQNGHAACMCVSIKANKLAYLPVGIKLRTFDDLALCSYEAM